MRSFILLAAIAAITACSDSGQTSKLPTQAAPAASADRAPDGPSPFGKPSSALSVQVIIGPEVSIPPGGSLTSVATCPAGTSVTGGGYEVFNLGPAPFVYRNREMLSQPGLASGWTASARNTAVGAQTATITAWVSCAS